MYDGKKKDQVNTVQLYWTQAASTENNVSKTQERERERENPTYIYIEREREISKVSDQNGVFGQKPLIYRSTQTYAYMQTTKTCMHMCAHMHTHTRTHTHAQTHTCRETM